MQTNISMASLGIYLVTLNCGREPVDVQALASQLYDGLVNDQLPDLLVLSLQEIGSVAESFIGGSLVEPYFKRIHDAVSIASRKLASETEAEPLKAVLTRHVGITAIMAFARDPSAISNIETAGVGFGVMEMGSKGAVGLRFTYQEPISQSSTELTFVAVHLAAMEGMLKRRNEDWKRIVERLVFTSSNSNDMSTVGNAEAVEAQPLLRSSARSSLYKPTSHVFVFGDLNYRTSVLPPGILDHQDTFPQPNDDPASDKHFLRYLLKDQLNQERKAGRTLHGFSEAEITFPPTYKYKLGASSSENTGENSRWQWAVHRWPSWCDRILYLETPLWLRRQHPEAKITIHKYSSLPLMATTDHKAVALSLSVPLIPIPVPDEDDESDDPRIHPPYPVDPTWKSRRFQARTTEQVVGLCLYLTTTFEGITVSAATLSGLVGGFFLLKLLIDMA